ncbi:FAS1 [Mytilus coruscus]|uniref:FAS1 n=1 Tax=Mytilus coruscus TaxID=42192 RepID=A0A6J8DKA0_MYTCO|nr:FAS1 [Mytilus coruscus]
MSDDPTATDTVYEVLQRTQGLSKFESLVRKASLVEFFQFSRTYTIFAPNDTAYENLTPDRKHIVDTMAGIDLQNFVKFHVIEGQRLMTGDFQDNSVRRSMSSSKLYINRREGVKFYTEILNKLSISGQFYDPIKRSSELRRRFTLFVPNDAINRIDSSKLRDLQQDVQKLHEVVRAHYIKNAVLFTTYVNHNQGFLNANQKSAVIMKYIHITGVSSVMTGDFQDNSVRRSMSSSKLYINRREGSAISGWFGPTTFFVNGAIISPEQKDLVGINGVVHGLMIWIDKTSLKTSYEYTQTPDNPKVNSTKFYTEILNKLSISGQFYDPIKDLQNYDGRFTLFVPNDAAINRIDSSKLRDLQQDVQKLHEVVRAHYIKNAVLFTTYVNHNQGFLNANQRALSIRKPYPYNVYVNSGGVTSAITMGNITVNNVFHNLLFDQLINRASEETRQALVTQTGVNVFAPTAEAFQKIKRVPWVSLNFDTKLIDKVLKLHILQPGQQVQVSNMVGEYESRQFRTSLYLEGTNPKITIYRQRNETWVQGDTVIAKVTQADIECTNGRIQFIDTIMGIPYLDLANLICSDLWLLRTYDYMRSLGMKNYLTDRRFYSQQCTFESQGYPPNYGINNYFNKVGLATIPPWTVNPPWDMGYCGTASSPCELTFFAPNSTAIDYFSNTNYGEKIMKNAYAFQRVLTRLMFRGKIELETLANTNYNYKSIHGDSIRISKSNDRFVTLYYQAAAARVIHMDNGATNGIVHIIDTILYVPDDLSLLTAGSSHVHYSPILLLVVLFLWITVHSGR